MIKAYFLFEERLLIGAHFWCMCLITNDYGTQEANSDACALILHTRSVMDSAGSATHPEFKQRENGDH